MIYINTCISSNTSLSVGSVIFIPKKEIICIYLYFKLKLFILLLKWQQIFMKYLYK